MAHKFDRAAYDARKAAKAELKKSQAGTSVNVKSLGDRVDKLEYVVGVKSNPGK